MLESAGSPDGSLRAYLRIGGITLARHQLSLVLALGCERIVCLARALDSELVALQHAAEQAGARFHVVTGPRSLVSLVTAGDEVIVIADGLIAAPEAALTQLEGGSVVLVQPVEAGLPAGYERIDLHHAAAGAMCVPGRLVERLSELPPDCDAASAVQRIALQAGVTQTILPASLIEEGAWRLVRDESEANAAEAQWIKLHTSPGKAGSITDMVLRLGVRSFGPALLHSGSGGNSVAIAAALSLLLGLSFAWLGFASTALALCGLAWALWRGASLLLTIERHSLQIREPRIPREAVFGWLFDLALISAITWNQPGDSSFSGLAARAFAPAMLVAMLRLIPRAVDANWAPWLHDRTLLCLVLAICAIGGLPAGLIPGLAAVLALLGVAWPASAIRLTRA
jgi:hypothetical protein